MYSLRKAQIAYLKADKIFTKVLSKYADFADIFLSKLAIELPKHMESYNHTIELMDNSQLLYSLIYSLRPVELETLKAYVKNNLTNSFIRLFKSPIGASIFFDRKSDNSLRLYMDYQGLNNLTI